MAVRVAFTSQFEYRFPNRMGMISFPAGYRGLVKDEVADAAFAAGVAEPEKGKRSGK